MTIPNIKIVALVVSLLSAFTIVLFMKLSKTGQAIRATAQNARAAKILGINTNRVYAITFAINAAICGSSWSNSFYDIYTYIHILDCLIL